MKLLSPVGLVLTVAASTLILGCTEDNQTASQKSAPTPPIKKLHGAGKKRELSCNMEALTIEIYERSESIPVNELLNNKGTEVAYIEDKRWRDKPAKSLVQLVTDWGEKIQQIEFAGCEENETVRLEYSEILAAPKKYVLLQNRVGRLRLAEFMEERKRYRTAVKNLHRVILIP